MTELKADFDRLLGLYDTFRGLRRGEPETWPDLVPVRLHVTDTRIDLKSEAARRSAFDKAMAALGAGEGWLRLQSALAWSGMAEPPGFATAGAPISGEWTAGNTASVRLLPDPAAVAGGRLYTVTEYAAGAEAPAEAFPCLRQQLSVLAHPRCGWEQLRYHIFWGVGPGEPHHAIRRRTYRFAGFADGGA